MKSSALKDAEHRQKPSELLIMPALLRTVDPQIKNSLFIMFLSQVDGTALIGHPGDHSKLCVMYKIEKYGFCGFEEEVREACRKNHWDDIIASIDKLKKRNNL